MRAHPNLSSKDLMAQVLYEFRVAISYWTAWRSRSRMLERINGNYEESYTKISVLKTQILHRNEGSIAKWYRHGETGEFVRFFLAYKASLDGFVNGCKPIIGLDDTFLKGKYGGCVLTTIGLDAMNGLFPLSIYICKGEDKFTWNKLLLNLRPHINKHAEKLTFISGRQKGLIDVVYVNFPESNHRYCSPYYHVNAFRATYAGWIFPFDDNVMHGDEVLPPSIERKAGRPGKQRIRGDDEERATSKRKCRKYKEPGHNSRICPHSKSGNNKKTLKFVHNVDDIPRATRGGRRGGRGGRRGGRRGGSQNVNVDQPPNETQVNNVQQNVHNEIFRGGSPVEGGSRGRKANVNVDQPPNETQGATRMCTMRSLEVVVEVVQLGLMKRGGKGKPIANTRSRLVNWD
ncbi:hypothetical protein IFM89_020480 [Coptis chinensis]|uniref:MULE transposase domain-containing protein n=1 Tax=Coptis chinensis TaxID=261450 RepID=A0A835LIR6_9MAGN|nr:hypothetical protein IFM89_020480 [Coptis chinensis]